MRSSDTKSIYNEVYRADGHNYGATGTADEALRPDGQRATVQRYLQAHAADPALEVVEIGCGLGHLHDVHPGWQGFEYSATAVDMARQSRPGLRIREGDARQLPLADDSVDFLFSFAALEHIPEVDRAFDEIARVLRPGGVALLSPAWNCRPWTVKKLQQRPYAELSFADKLRKALIPLREHLAWRLLASLPGRIRGELGLLAGTPVPLRYRPLEPDFSLWDRYPHISDDDAFANIDAHAALVYFASRGWACESHPTLMRRFACRGEEILVRKPLNR